MRGVPVDASVVPHFRNGGPAAAAQTFGARERHSRGEASTMDDVTAGQGRARPASGFPSLTDIGTMRKRGDLALAFGILTILVVLILPLPSIVLDLFLAISITLSILILMTSLFIQAPLEFSSFPTILLISTMLRLSLNLASTRLILSRGHEGTAAAGHVIEAFGFGAMDGASKFVRGDAIAGLLVVLINIIGGIVIGIVQQSLSFADAAHTYTLLTVGDGLVTQIPALIVSTAAGLLVSKAGVAGAADKALLSQLSGYPKALGMSAAVMLVMALLPGIPMVPFLALGGGTASLAYLIHRRRKKSAAADDAKKAETEKTAPAEEPMSATLKMDDLKIELGSALLPLVNASGRRPPH